MKDFKEITTPQELAEALKELQGIEQEVDPTKFRFVLYARKSTNEAENKQVRSLPDQVNKCKEYAEDHGLKIVDIIQEAESAKESGIRPKFKRMIELLEAGKYDAILAWHPDRLARNMKDAGEVIDLLDKKIIKDLKFVSFSFQNTTSGKMLLGITFALSKEFSDKLSDDVSRGNERSIGEGKYINKSKHGYYKDSSQYLRPDEENFIFIKNAFKMRAEGRTMDEIADYLNKNGYKRVQKDGSRKLFIWGKGTIQSLLLTDPIYAGVVVYGDAIQDLTSIYDFRPAISVTDFMKINKLGTKEKLIMLGKKQKKKDGIKADLMREMIFCGECGEPMHSGITPKKNKDGVTKYFYYRCDTDGCKNYGKSVRAKVVIDYIKDFLNQKPFSSPASYEHYKEEMTRLAGERAFEAKKILQSFQANKRKLEERLASTKEMLLSDTEKEVKDAYVGNIKVINENIKVMDENIEAQREVVSRERAGILTYEEFLELMGKTAQIIGKTAKMKDLDYLCRKLYMNFTIQGKKVIKSTLVPLFEELYQAKVQSSGHERT